eukprot:SAG11_NODE_33570_length_276_cov_1.163842_1_plen_41_part_01
MAIVLSTGSTGSSNIFCCSYGVTDHVTLAVSLTARVSVLNL